MTKQAYWGIIRVCAASLYFGRQLPEYARLLGTFLKLYCQARLLMAQNYLLSCKLRAWEVVFLYLRVRIFFVRLAHGLPMGQCWPRE